ncbi:MAG: YiiX/YebB-like N1pC/P60 family cysteine hydrolase [Bdellovibrionia bacterium]
MSFFPSREPASTDAFINGTSRILADLKDPRVFNAQTCFSYIDNLTTSLFNLPTDYFFPKSESQSSALKTQGPQVLKNLFNSRHELHLKLQEFSAKGQLSLQCVNAIREGKQYIRYAEDFLIEWLIENDVYENQSPQILADVFPYTLKVDREQNLNLKAGDVLLVRGKSYISAMIARIGDEEGNFSHMAIVGEDKNGNLHVAESLIQKGLIVTPLAKWLKDQDARVALYRYQDSVVAQKAAREIYDHAMSYINRGTTKRYDFSMNDGDDNEFFCSEVIGWAYKKASNGQIVLPQFRSQTTKFENTDFFESLLIKKGDLFAPFDIEVDSRFDFIAEYRYLPLLRQVRMQDSVLQSIYKWMSEKNYDFYATPDKSIKAVLAKILRQFGLVQDKLPTYMPYKTLLTTLKYEGVATALEKNIYKIEREYYDKNGHSLAFKDLMEINENYRIQDCEIERAYQRASKNNIASTTEIKNKPSSLQPSEFHWFFNNRKATNCVE